MLTLWLICDVWSVNVRFGDALHVHRRLIQYRLDKILTVTGLNPRAREHNAIVAGVR